MFSKTEKIILCLLAVILISMTITVVALTVEVVVQPSLDEVSVYDVVDDSWGAIPYAKRLHDVPVEIIQSFTARGWTFRIDFDHNAQLSMPMNTNWGGVADYAAKTIWVRYPDSVIHEFGHYLDIELGFPKYHEELYELESQSAESLLGHYSTTNCREYFAEVFDYWVNNQDDVEAMGDLQEVAPATYEYFLELSQNHWGLSTDAIVVKVSLPWD